jgi:mRNA interferase HigB
MHIITPTRLTEFWKEHPNAEQSLKRWRNITKKAHWQNIIETRQDFPHADMAGECTIFNVSGNNFRIITKIYYETGTLLIRFILTHAEYDKGVYKNDCNC